MKQPNSVFSDARERVSEKTLITAAICTHDRGYCVGVAVDSLLRQTLASRQYEVLLIDNACRPEESETLRELAEGHHQIRVIDAPVLGLSHARNVAIENAHGDIIAFLDDDAIASEDWLARIVNRFQTYGDRLGLLTGLIEPVWLRPRPYWLSDDLLGNYSVYSWSDHLIELGPGQWVAGANLAARCNVLKAIGGFPVALGRTGGNLISNEESFVRQLLESDGYVSCMTLRSWSNIRSIQNG